MKFKIHNFSFSSLGKDDIPVSHLLKCRAKSGLHGREDQQNPAKNYFIKPNSIHSIATLDNKVVGYSIAQVWTTKRVFDMDWTKSYQNDLGGDTIAIKEIVVARQATGQNLGHALLKSTVGYRNELFGDKELQRMEMSILSTNAASERMFSKFAREYGNSVTIGDVHESEMGNYIDWTIGLNKSGKSRSFVKVGASFEFQRHEEKTLLLKRKIDFVEQKVKQEIKSSVDSIQKPMKRSFGLSIYPRLPPQKKYAEIIDLLDKHYQIQDVEWKDGKVSGAIYHGGKDLQRLITEAFSLFTVSNPLHPEIFPGIRKMEAEIVSMVKHMYNGPEDGCGSVTSGGSESILMSIKAHRDWALAEKGITEPELIAPISAHAAFDKGCQYFKVKLVHIPVNDDGTVNIKLVKAAINSNTIMLVGSTPNFPHGSIDDIPALSELAIANNIGLHVDSCLGGFLVPFMSQAGFPLPFVTDFRLKGVTSLSCDTHKYGFAPKGSSVILYSSSKLRKYQYFLQPNWSGGVYGSPTMAGSRPGALSAGCWAAMMYFGQDGYTASTKKIIQTARDIKSGIKNIKGLEVIGDPLLSVVAFRATEFNTYALAELLSRKEYHLNVLQFPPAIHIACTMLTVPTVDRFIGDLREMVEILRKDPKAGEGATAAIYGTAAGVSDRSIIGEVVEGFLDGLTVMPESSL